LKSRLFDDDIIGGIRDDIHFCAGGNGKDTCQVRARPKKIKNKTVAN